MAKDKKSTRKPTTKAKKTPVKNVKKPDKSAEKALFPQDSNTGHDTDGINSRSVTLKTPQAEPQNTEAPYSRPKKQDSCPKCFAFPCVIENRRGNKATLRCRNDKCDMERFEVTR